MTEAVQSEVWPSGIVPSLFDLTSLETFVPVCRGEPVSALPT